ncbi:MAG: DUF1854 domain-containing protein [Candidatus Latescibacteria bacterium]|jgi:hypothetical protein|nr:hypothetical protein [Gemmatimonadaceae bacterium]MDP6016608.1 DUF1854 domain-containing protein [Candidatus Latescibacterota bacterium]MDP7447096.1 DUF1854 domain-containing protein [Candidatus Latescibacterota bacterium]HJP32628.1 DUF1854 domain-containing protein [Candidatus Latescibacterota bacterium]
MSEIDPTYDLMDELSVLDPGTARLWVDGYDELWLQIGEAEARGPLGVQRAFPLTMADEFVSLKDGDGDEIAVIRRLGELDPDSRAAVESHLSWSYFASTIVSVYSIEVQYHIPHWDVETDRGRRVFELLSSRRDVRALPGGGALIRDADGNLYEIPNVSRLDAASRAIVEDYV